MAQSLTGAELTTWPAQLSRLGQPPARNDMDGYDDDLGAVISALDLKDAVPIGHSTGSSEVARCIGRHGTGRVKKAVLVAAVPLAHRTA